jgi:Rhodopirellula transposase DDE domain
VITQSAPEPVYDVAADTGSVSVGTDHDTAAFAVETIRRWWQATGPTCYPQASRLLITADGGGSNGYRTRLWKTELAALAADTGLQITVCHLPPGTSKWTRSSTDCSPTSLGLPLPRAQPAVAAAPRTTR